MMGLTLFEILLYGFVAIYSISVIALTFRLLNLCNQFNELLMIVRKQAGVRELNGKLHPIDEYGSIIQSRE